MGIDPGTNKMGYGVIRVQGKKVEYVAMGHIDLSKEPDTYAKLRRIYERVEDIVSLYKPSEVAFEAPFYGENVQSMLKLGRAQGVAMAAALTRKVAVAEYAPSKVKIAITGSGSASKEQVASVLKNVFKLQVLPKNKDATDGLAVALCHHYQSINKFATGSSEGGWASFIKNNPQRVSQGGVRLKTPSVKKEDDKKYDN